MNYIHDNSDPFLDAFSELTGLELEILELINVDYDEDSGSSGDFHYGYYLSFPQKHDIDTEVLEQLKKDYPEADIPFGETLYYTDADFSNTKADPLGSKGIEDKLN